MKKEKKLLLGISASPRARLSTQGYIDILGQISDYQKMYEVIYEFASEKRISNTEGLMLASLFGARSEDVDIEVVNLRDVFQSGKITEQGLTEKLNRCSGVIAATPVYFGDKSSWLDKLVTHIRINNIETKNKIFGAVTAGAKRNGGQETTLIFALLDALNLGFNVVGNGPPTSQFGGTGWAGDIGKIQDDNFGLNTSMGLGSRIKRYLEVASAERVPYSELTIGILHSGFQGNDKEIEDMIKNIEEQGAKAALLDIDELKIKPCLACSRCPAAMGTDYGCVTHDDMKKMRGLSSSIDGLIFMLCKGRKVRCQYQTFIERTRFIRRDNFIMSDLPFGAYFSENGFIGNQYTTRMFTAFLRHNMFIVSPLIQLLNDGKHIIRTNAPKELCSRLLDVASKSKIVRDAKESKYHYEAIGYGKK